MEEESKNIGDKFQQLTKYDPCKMSGGGLNWEIKPEIYKQYNNATIIGLPKPKLSLPAKFDSLLKRRRSQRNFKNEPITLEDLSYLLWAATGIQRVESGFEYRTAPSAGALYPIETYLVINNVKQLENGVYHYSVKNHQLEVVILGLFGQKLAAAALNQQMCSNASVVFIFTAIFNRSKWKYKQRAYRYIYLDAGHIAQNLILAVESLNLGSCPVAAMFDDEINQILTIDGINESGIYLVPVGHPK
ncbi:MAG: SagB/ThcOx family dehydrogenase [archaeon]|nr:SagB/ThcOx family dehydrogenase [archaeon]